MELDNYIIWAIAALVLFVIEMFTASFAVICLSLGAFAASIASYFGANIKIELIVFSVVTLLSFIIVRPLALKMFAKKSKTVATNSDAMLGQTVIVTEKIDVVANTGLVKINGEIWRACTNDDSILEIGDRAQIEKIDSTVLIIKKI